MLEIYWPAFVVAFLVSLLELTEVVALVFALSSDAASIRPGAFGATAGVTVVALIAIGFGAVLLLVPRSVLLWAAAAVLAGFGVYLFRGTLRAYRRAAAGGPPPKQRGTLAFSGGFTVGVVEATEAVIVLLAITAAGYGFSAVVGAVLAGAILVVVALVVHQQIRRIKVLWLRLGGTALLFTFSIFWAGEAAGVPWPGSDLILIPLVVGSALVVRGLIALMMRGSTSAAHPSPPAA